MQIRVLRRADQQPKLRDGRVILPGRADDLRVVEPAGESGAFFIRLAELSQSGGYDRFGMPKPKAGARIIRDFPEQRSALLPVGVQQALSRLLLRREQA